MKIIESIFNTFAKPIIIGVVVVVFGTVIFGQSAYDISEQEVAIVYTFAKFSKMEELAGWHFKIPFIQRVSKVSTVTNESQIGYSTLGYNTATSPEMGDEWAHVEGDGLLLMTSDSNLVKMSFYTEWRITDPVDMDINVRDPRAMVEAVLESSIREIVSGFTVDETLTNGKAYIEIEVKDNANEILDGYGLGLTVTNVIIQDSEPPTSRVSQAFKDVESARQNKITEINRANKIYNSAIPQARAQADKSLQEAESYKQQRIFEAEGQVARFTEMYEEYKLNPNAVSKKLYYEMLDEILPKMKVVIDGSGDTLQIFNHNVENVRDTETTSNSYYDSETSTYEPAKETGGEPYGG